MISKTIALLSMLLIAIPALAYEPDIQCSSYADSENGTELKVIAYKGTYIQSVIGSQTPTELGSAVLTDDIVRNISTYEFASAPESLKGITLNFWSDETFSTGFRGQLIFSGDSSPTTMVCNWL
jgi:hypothetical protein